MLIRPCHRVLKAINYLCSHSSTTSQIDLMVYFHQRINALDLSNTIQQLSDDGYISIITGAVCDEIKPTYKGRHYFEYRWIATKEILLKSFILPVLVALITTVITLAANGFSFPVP